MELPFSLQAGVEAALYGLSAADLSKAAASLSLRYRGEVLDGRLHLSDDLKARAYLATRLPATYAAIRTALEETAFVLPDFAPRTLFDVGAGPGSLLWAAADRWPGLEEAELVEASPAIRHWGQILAKELPVRIRWTEADLRLPFDVSGPLDVSETYDLVGMAYVLNELSAEKRLPLIERLWSMTEGVLVIVEPGTPAGWQRLLSARQRLIDLGALIAAPCPHALPCPLEAPDWCHFSRKVSRSRLHRQAKGGTVPWEDEKFLYLAASRLPCVALEGRVVAPPRTAGGRLVLPLCQASGKRCDRLLSKRDGAAFKQARRLRWGEGVPSVSSCPKPD